MAPAYLLARVPGSTRRDVHLFIMEPERASWLSLCGGVDADPAWLDRAAAFERATCLGCQRAQVTVHQGEDTRPPGTRKTP